MKIVLLVLAICIAVSVGTTSAEYETGRLQPLDDSMPQHYLRTPEFLGRVKRSPYDACDPCDECRSGYCAPGGGCC